VDFVKQDHVQAGLSVVVIGTAVGWVLWKIRKAHFLGSIPEEVRSCLRKSCGFALCTLGLGSTPVFIFRKLGWKAIRPLYTQFLYNNVYTTILSLVGVLALSIFAILYPINENKRTKYTLWASTCLSVGTMFAPIALTPRDILTTVSGYVIGLTVPTAISIAISPNFLFLNIFSFLSMSLTTMFMQSQAIPWVINRRHVERGLIPIIPTGITSSIVLPFIFGMALLMMLHMNLFVWYIKDCHEKKKIPVEQKKRSWFFKIDGTDEVTNGMIIAGYVFYTFLRIWWEMMRLIKRSVTELVSRGRIREALE